MKKKTLLLVFIHGFKGGDQTFQNFPQDLRALLQHTLPQLEVLSAVYPVYETRGDLGDCVARFTEWLQNKVLDLEVANDSRSPTLHPSVHVVLCGHSMGGIVAAETLLKAVRDYPVPNMHADETSSAQPGDPSPPAQLFFPHIRAVIAFDTPYLGISPGVLAHGAEEQINHASKAYKAFDSASQIFGWNSSKSTSAAAAAADASNKALPAATTATGGATAAAGAGGATGTWGRWGKYAAMGGAAAAIAGAAGAAYLNRDQITQGITWAGSHLEFVGCLARGAELQKRVEKVVELTRTHNIGFADYYTALGEKVTSQTKYAGSVLGDDRTFCVTPKHTRSNNSGNSPTGSKRDAPQPSSQSESTTAQNEGEQVQNFAADPTRSKGRWVKCVNDAAPDELKAHTTMFTPRENPDYHHMLPQARDQIVEWVDRTWYEESEEVDDQPPRNEKEGMDNPADATDGSEKVDVPGGGPSTTAEDKVA